MAPTPRLAAAALAVVALGLTVTGVVIAATDSSVPGSSGADALALNGYPPTTATIDLTASTAAGSAVSGTVAVDFSTGALEAQVQIPLAFSSVSADLRMVNGHTYLGIGNLASVVGAPWVSVPSPRIGLYGIALEMTKPDIALISAYDSRTVSTANGITTYTFHWAHSHYHAPAAFPLSVPAGSAVTLALSVGSQGELTGGTLTTTTRSSTMTISMTVTSYNRPVHVTAPPAGQVRPITGSQLGKILGGLSLPSLGGSLVIPSPGGSTPAAPTGSTANPVSLR